MLWIGSLEDTHVQIDPGTLGRLAQEAGGDVGRQAPDALAGELDVRDEARLVVALERGHCECLCGGHDGPAEAGGAWLREQVGERGAERAARGRHGLVRPPGGDLEAQLEATRPRELADQMVQDGKAGRDVRRGLG